MKLTIRIFLFLIFALTCNNAYAGAGVCHDGAGNITSFEWDADHGFYSTQPNCQYYSDAEFHSLKQSLDGVPRKYIKWDNGPKEMTQAEKDALDQAEADARKVARRERIKQFFRDNPEFKVFLSLVFDEFNRNRQWDNKQQLSLQDLLDAIDAKIDGGLIDE